MDRLKDLYNSTYIQKVACAFKEVNSTFNEDSFFKLLYKNWQELSLKERMLRLSFYIKEQMPEDFLLASAQLEAAHRILSDGSKQSYMLNMFMPEIVVLYGFDFPYESLKCLKNLTVNSSSEFGIRPFIEKHPDICFSLLLTWCDDDSDDVRRLASEGIRPHLPWGKTLKKLQENPTPIWPILEKLKRDPSLYVRKSVANNINDISKTHPEMVLNWAQKNFGQHPHTDWIIKHGLRTLLKKGHEEALAIFGFDQNLSAVTDIRSALSTEQICINDVVDLDLSFHLKREKFLRIEYKISFPKAKNKRSEKIFMFSEKKFTTGNHYIKKSISFKNLSTRKLYSGIHHIEILINAVPVAKSHLRVE